MRSVLLPKNWWLLLFIVPFLIQGMCNKEDDSTPNADQYATWQIPGQSGNLKSPVDSFLMVRYNNTTAIYAMSSANTKQFEVEFDSQQTPGYYFTNRFTVLVNGHYYVQSSTPVQINVSEYGSSGQYLIGTYSGTVKDSTTASNVAVSGSFKIKNQ